MSVEALPAPFPEAGYFMRRLHRARLAQEATARIGGPFALTASMSYDLARSPLSDDELDEALQAFAPDERPTWGLSDLLSDMLSREPQTVSVSNLRRLQRNLILQGYTSPDAALTGTWDPSWHAAFTRLERDAREEQLRGHHPGAAPIEAGVRLITATLPSVAWQNIVGAAKGIIEQAPETAERVGALGGAAGGAVIGAAAGSVIPGVGTAAGAVGGAIVGGIGGFLADLFGEEGGEQGQGVAANIADALTPFEEYSGAGGAGRFFEDLGFVATAASLISGAGIAARGVAAGAGAIRAGMATGSPVLRAALARPVVTEPGWLTRITAAALRPAIGAARVERYVGWVRLNGLMAQTGRPIFRLANGAYSGLARGSVGVHLASGLGSPAGEYADAIRGVEATLADPKTPRSLRGELEAEIDRLRTLEARSRTTISAAIAETDPLPAWVDLSTLLLYPQKLLPVDFGRMAAGARRVLGDTSLAPIANIVQRTERLPLRSAVGRARELLGADELEQAATLTWLRRNFGIDMTAARRVAELGMDGSEVAAEGAFIRARSSIIARLRREAAEGGGELGSEVMRWAEEQPAAFEGWLLDRSPTRLPDYLAAERLAQSVTADIRSGALSVAEDQIRGRVIADAEAGFDVMLGRSKIHELLEEAKRLERRARGSTDPNVTVMATEQAVKLRAEAQRLKANLPKVRSVERTRENLVIVAERLETPTSADLRALADRYRRAREEIRAASKAAGEASVSVNSRYLVARRAMSDLVDTDLARLLPVDLLEAARKADPPLEVAEHLEARARYAAQQIDLGPELGARFEALGYKPVVTSGEVLFSTDAASLGKLADVGGYTRRAAFFETIGLGLRKEADDSIYQLVSTHRAAELDQVMAEAGVPLTGGQALGMLYRKLSTEARRGAVRGPLQFTEDAGMRGIRMPRVDLRDLTPDEILATFEKVPGFTDDTARAVYAAVRRASAYGAEATLREPMDTLRSLGRALRINGLPGFADFMRTARIHHPDRLVPLGALAGAGLGAVVGDEGLEDVLRGSAGGALLALGARAFAKGAYGYLPDRLVRLNTALRYSLSFAFDAGRYTEASSTMMARYAMPGIFRPRRYIERLPAGASPYSSELVKGEEAWEHALRFADELNGGTLFKNIDDIDRRATQAGLLGFKPREHEAAYALLGYRRGWSTEQIREAVAQVSRYGLGRTAAEKSANFVFFPFSFAKKYLSTLGDFLVQAPARALLVHEGLRRYHGSSLDEGFHDLIEDHLPLLDQLAQVNNLVYGISPGRFFLEGITDRRSVGAVTQALASVFVPGGAATPLAQAAGGVGDLAIHAFVPVVITGESIDRAGGIDGLEDVLRRYVPLVREIDQYFVQGEGGTLVGGAVGEQLTALTQGRAPYAQFGEYLDELREFKAALEPIALALGYASADGFLASNAGTGYQARYKRLREELGRRYPTAERMLSSFESSTMSDQRAMLDLGSKPDRSAAEDAILYLAQIQESWRLIGEVLGLPAELAGSLVARRIRAEAERWVSDRRFAELYDRFFAREYGPIVRVA